MSVQLSLERVVRCVITSCTCSAISKTVTKGKERERLLAVYS